MQVPGVVPERPDRHLEVSLGRGAGDRERVALPAVRAAEREEDELAGLEGEGAPVRLGRSTFPPAALPLWNPPGMSYALRDIVVCPRDFSAPKVRALPRQGSPYRRAQDREGMSVVKVGPQPGGRLPPGGRRSSAGTGSTGAARHAGLAVTSAPAIS